MIFRKRKAETLEEKFARLLAFNHDMVGSTRSSIGEFGQASNVSMVLSNFSHLIHYYSDIATMHWRTGQDPHEAIERAHEAYVEMITYQSRFDPDHQTPMADIAGITDWDLVYSLFWLSGKSEPFEFGFPNILLERYFAYSRYILHRITDTEIPGVLDSAVEAFHSEHDELVDHNFGDLLMLLGDVECDDEIATIVARIAGNWRRRRNAKFFHTSAPLLAGNDASNDLNVDYQLACVVRKQGWQFTENPHLWRWN